MKRTDKTTYISPVCEVVECRLEGVLAASPMMVFILGDDDLGNPAYNEGVDWDGVY